MSIRSVTCPKSEDHASFDKATNKSIQRDRTMFMFDDDSIYLHCERHGYMKFKFYKKNGEKVSFENVSVTAHSICGGFIPNEPIQVTDYGEFERKKKKCRA